MVGAVLGRACHTPRCDIGTYNKVEMSPVSPLGQAGSTIGPCAKRPADVRHRAPGSRLAI
jgi:hypothetical protein